MWFPDFPAIGFFISYIATSLLVLEALRLISADANKREAERFLDRYIGASKTAPSPESSLPPQQQHPREPIEPNPAQPSPPAEHTTAFTLEDLDEMASSHHHQQHRHRRARTPSPTTPSRARTLASPAPVRQSRTRSNTLTSTSTSSSAQSRHSSVSRHSHSSSSSSSSSSPSSTSRPNSTSRSKTSPERASSRTKHRGDDEGSRRQGSPGFRRSREAQGLGSALQRLVRGKA